MECLAIFAIDEKTIMNVNAAFTSFDDIKNALAERGHL